MAAPRSFYINRGPLPEIKCERPLVIMGFNFERGVAEMLHSLCHRVESTICLFDTGDLSDFAAEIASGLRPAERVVRR
jgi:hypothetical protein